MEPETSKATLEHFFNYDGYMIQEELGEGQYGRVYLATGDKGKTVAIKAVNLNYIKKHEILERQFNRELEALRLISKTDNPNVVKLKKELEMKDGAQYLMFLEYCDSGDLENYLQNNAPGGKLSEQTTIQFMNQILNGMSEIHKLKIIHRDFKEANIFIHQNVLKIGDFGFSRQLDDDQEAGTFVGTPMTMAPEVLDGQKYNIQADMFSLGVVFYKMLFGNYPFQARSIPGLKKNIKTQQFDQMENSDISKEVQQLLKQMLKYDPKERITWTQLYDHPVFKAKPQVQKNNFLLMSSVDLIKSHKQEEEPKPQGQKQDIKKMYDDIMEESWEKIGNQEEQQQQIQKISKQIEKQNEERKNNDNDDEDDQEDDGGTIKRRPKQLTIDEELDRIEQMQNQINGGGQKPQNPNINPEVIQKLKDSATERKIKEELEKTVQVYLSKFNQCQLIAKIVLRGMGCVDYLSSRFETWFMMLRKMLKTYYQLCDSIDNQKNIFNCPYPDQLFKFEQIINLRQIIQDVIDQIINNQEYEQLKMQAAENIDDEQGIQDLFVPLEQEIPEFDNKLEANLIKYYKDCNRQVVELRRPKAKILTEQELYELQQKQKQVKEVYIEKHPEIFQVPLGELKKKEDHDAKQLNQIGNLIKQMVGVLDIFGDGDECSISQGLQLDDRYWTINNDAFEQLNQELEKRFQFLPQ